MRSERLKRWLKVTIALAISAVFTALFLLNTDLSEVGDALTGANYVYVVPALGLFGLSVAARALRWRYLYLPHHERSWATLLPPLLIGYAGNNVLPLRAGEILRAQAAANRAGLPWMVTFGTFIMERLFDFMVLASLVLAGVLIAGEGSAYLAAGIALFGATAIGFVVAMYFARNPAQARRLASLRLPLVPARFRDDLADLAESFLIGCACLTDARRVAIVSAVTAVSWLLEFGMYWALTPAFGLDPGFFTVAFAGAAANVALSIPAAQGGIGPFDVTATQAFAAFNVTGEAVKAYVVALHVFLVVPVSIAGLLVLWRSAIPSPREASANTAPDDRLPADRGDSTATRPSTL